MHRAGLGATVSCLSGRRAGLLQLWGEGEAGVAITTRGWTGWLELLDKGAPRPEIEGACGLHTPPSFSEPEVNPQWCFRGADSVPCRTCQLTYELNCR